MCYKKRSLYIKMDVLYDRVLLEISSMDRMELVTFLPVECFPGCLLFSSHPVPARLYEQKFFLFYFIKLAPVKEKGNFHPKKL